MPPNGRETPGEAGSSDEESSRADQRQEVKEETGDPDARVSVSWKEGMQFEARTARGAVTTVDGEGKLSPSPVELLLESLAACAGIDVVEILRKGRHDVESLEVGVTGRRREEPPRRFTDVEMVFRIRGDVPRRAAERAVALSLDRYCSVHHTLAGDLEVESRVELLP